MQFLPGDKVFWYRFGKEDHARKIEAEIYYRPTDLRVAIRFRDKAGDRIVRFVSPDSLERFDGEDCTSRK